MVGSWLRGLFGSAWWQRVFGNPLRWDGTMGRPQSSNAASSFHLWWEFPGSPTFQAVSVDIEVVDRANVPRLYFWALQASFAGTGRAVAGGAHLGLQHHPSYPGQAAVNWGGYHSTGGELSGSTSALPSTLGNANTKDFRWHSGRVYRLEISPSPDPAPDGLVAWRGTVTDLETDDRTVVRDLYVRAADRLVSPVVWTECFADCDHPSAGVRWSRLTAVDENGTEVNPTAVRVTYQSVGKGGCVTTNAIRSGDGVLQLTGVTRTTPEGRRIQLD